MSPYEPSWARTRTLQTVKASGTPVYLDAWEYQDGLGRTVESQQPGPRGGRIVTATEYDDRGLLRYTSAPMYNASTAGAGLLNASYATVPISANHAYDALGREIITWHANYGDEQWRTTITYGNSYQVVDPPVGATGTISLDVRGRPTSLVMQAETTSTTRYGYDRRGELTSITDPLGNVTTDSYDLLSRHTEATDPDSGRSSFTYNADGTIRTSTDARGRTRFHAYDALGRATAVQDGSATGPRLAEWAYDTLPGGTPVRGLRVRATSFDGGNAYTRELLAVDAAGRPTRTRIVLPPAEGALAGGYEFGSGYDDAGHPTSTSYPAAGGLSAETVTTAYTDQGYLSTLTGTSPYVTTTDYDAAGPLSSRVYGGGTAGQARRAYSYEPGTLRLSTVTTYAGAALAKVQEDVFSYDAIANPVRREEHTATGAVAAAECFRYDKLNRLTVAWTTTATCATEPTSGTAGGISPYHEAYTYDALGNRRTETNKLSATPVTRTYTYPASGTGSIRPHAVQSIAGGASGADSFSYDAAGHTTRRSLDGGSTVADYAWDIFGRVDRVDTTRTSGGSSVTERTDLIYDADGARLIRREPSGTTAYLDGMELRLTGQTSVTAQRHYAHGASIVAVRGPTGLHWLLNDGQASVEISVDAATGQATRRRYRPFGEERGGGSAAWPTEHGYLGKTHDTALGTIHLGAREFDPVEGRFLSTDPIQRPLDPGGLNPYSYADNNPVANSDPTGLRPILGGGFGASATHRPVRPASRSWLGGGFGAHGRAQRPVGGGRRDVKHGPGNSPRIKAFIDFGNHSIPACSDIPLCAAAAEGIRRLTLIDELARAYCKYFGCAEGRLSGISGSGGWTQLRVGEGKLRPIAAGGWQSSGGSGRLECHSFDPNTKIVMADGRHRRIRDVKLGDKVLATDPHTGKVQGRTVSALHVNQDTHLADVTVVTGDGTVHRVHTTQHHQFWNATTKAWTDAADLHQGDLLLVAGTGWARVVDVRSFVRPRAMLDLTVAEIHTYYVLAGKTPVLVHNCNTPKGFAGKDDYNEFVGALNSGLVVAGYVGTVAAFQGSSVTGVSFIGGRPFGAHSDYDIAIGGADIFARARELGIPLRSGGTRTGPLNPDEIQALGLSDMRAQLQRMAAGRPVNFMIFDSIGGATARSASILAVLCGC